MPLLIERLRTARGVDEELEPREADTYMDPVLTAGAFSRLSLRMSELCDELQEYQDGDYALDLNQLGRSFELTRLGEKKFKLEVVWMAMYIQVISHRPRAKQESFIIEVVYSPPRDVLYKWPDGETSDPDVLAEALLKLLPGYKMPPG